eukprot:GHRQ01031580.1.p1 GENE.GHRQ01031580.1~~GHRQ01031580.1.p1  ORF type:complete len:373 (+),score=136.04 GHRQ01031580.1:189-1307(+)
MLATLLGGGVGCGAAHHARLHDVQSDQQHPQHQLLGFPCCAASAAGGAPGKPPGKHCSSPVQQARCMPCEHVVINTIYLCFLLLLLLLFAVLPAGFFLFVGLAFYFCTHPPTPLLVTAEHVEVLLHGLQQKLQQQLHSLHVGENLQALGHGFSEKVHAVEHSLQDKVHALEHRLQDGVHKLEGRLSGSLADNLHQLQDSIHSLQDNVQAVWQGSPLGGKLHQLQDSLHSVELGLQLKAAGLSSNLASKAGVVQAALMQQLQPVLQWPVPRWPVYVYFAGAMVCLLTSSTCHLLGCCKQHIAELVWRFDYAGIAVLIVTSFVPAMYYAFLCEPWWRNFYLITTVTMGGSAGAVHGVSPLCCYFVYQGGRSCRR